MNKNRDKSDKKTNKRHSQEGNLTPHTGSLYMPSASRADNVSVIASFSLAISLVKSRFTKPDVMHEQESTANNNRCLCSSPLLFWGVIPPLTGVFVGSLAPVVAVCLSVHLSPNKGNKRRHKWGSLLALDFSLVCPGPSRPIIQSDEVGSCYPLL